MVGCVVLTTGSRPEVLALALESLLAQRGVEPDIVEAMADQLPCPC